MVRRVFLTVVTGAILGGMATLLLPRLAHATVNGPARILKGASSGQVLESLDGGNTWQVCADLGSDIVIQRLAQQDAQFFLRADFRGYNVVLKSPNGHTWYTSEWMPPSGSFRRTFLTMVGG
jgi:hypothetical protein